MFNEKKNCKRRMKIILLTLIILKYFLKNLIHPAKVQYTLHISLNKLIFKLLALEKQ